MNANETRKPGDDLRDYIADARATLGLTPPAYDDLRLVDDAFVSLAALQKVLDWATQSLNEPEKVTGNQDLADGYRSALLHVLAAAEDAIEDSRAAIEAHHEHVTSGREARPLAELKKELDL